MTKCFLRCLSAVALIEFLPNTAAGAVWFEGVVVALNIDISVLTQSLQQVPG